jgi:O-antigen ligase
MMDRAAKYTLLAIGFFIPLSTALVNVGFGLLLLFFVFSGHYRDKWNTISRNPIALLCLGLFLLLSIGTLYSTATFQDATHVLMKYRKLLWVALLIPFLQDPQWRRWATAAFLAAMLVTLCLSYAHLLHAWFIKLPLDNATVFKNHIAQNFLMAFTVYLLLHFSFNPQIKKWIRIFAAIAAIFAICNIFIFVQGRTGYVVLVALLMLIAWQQFGLRGILVGTGIITLLLSTLFFASQSFQQRIIHTAQEVETYQTSNAITSAGLRLEFYKKTLQIIQLNPLIGQGTGSLANAYANLTTESTGASSVKTLNPHNEYLMITAQIGIVGLLLFLYLLFQLWKQSYKLPHDERQMAQGMVVAFATGCLLNSLLLDFTEGHWFAYFAAVFYATITNRPKNV